MVTRGLLASLLLSSVAYAQQQPAPFVGATETAKLTTPMGFFDDVVALDSQRVAYVLAETGTKAELHVMTLATKQEITVDLSPVTLRPTALAFAGPRVLVVGQVDNGQVAALVDLEKKTFAYRLGPATHITVIARDGKPRVAVHRATPTKTSVKHEVDLVAIETGKKLSAGRPLELTGGLDKKLDFRVNHWGDGYTRAFGTKGGEWIKKENQRSPDTEATYDLLARKLVDEKPITDLFEQRKRFQLLASVGDKVDFVRADQGGIQLWRGGKPTAVALDDFAVYDPASLQGIVMADGSAWIAIKVDPVNPAAVARKKADPEYLDVYRVSADGKAQRTARVLAKGVRHRFGIGETSFWLLERSNGFDRGGRALSVYRLP